MAINSVLDIDSGWNRSGNVTGYNPQAGVNTSSLTLQLQTQAEGPAPSLLLQFLTPTIFRLRFNASGNYAQDNSYAVNVAALPTQQVVVQDTGAELVIDTGSIVITIQKAPYALTVSANGVIISQDAPNPLVYIAQSVANFKMIPNPTGHYYGFGETGGANMNKYGQQITLFNYDAFCAPISDSSPMYVSIPLLIESNPYAQNPYNYGIFLDNPSQTFFNIGNTGSGSQLQTNYYIGALFGELNYYFIYGDTLAEIVGQYTTITGRMPMFPKYVLGFHQGCYGYNPQNLLEGIAAKYRNNLIPCDGLHIDIVFQYNYCTFTSNPNTFANAPALMTALHNQGFKCSTNITSMVNYAPPGNIPGSADGSYLAMTSGVAANIFLRDPNFPDMLYVGTENYGNDLQGNSLTASGYYPDLTNPVARTWWGQQYTYLINTVGLDMVWQDMMCPAIYDPTPNSTNNKTFPPGIIHYDFGRNTPNIQIHNIHGLMMLAGTQQGLSALRPNSRNFVIARGGYAGLQKYAGLWTGDSASDWANYQRNIPMVLNLGLSGVPISGSDIGGFANGLAGPTGEFVTPELLTRWMTMGAFLPWYRNHYDGYTKQFQEPFNYNGVVGGAEVLADCQKYINLRYRLLQYFYDYMWIAHETGVPIARPLFMNYPLDQTCYISGNADSQFFVGESIMVAPVMTQGDLVTTVYLPKGTQWYYFTDLQPLGLPANGASQFVAPPKFAIQGSQTPQVLWDEVPVFIRAGAIIPMRQLEQFVGQKLVANKPTNYLTFDIYPLGNTTYSLYLDDGISNDYLNDKYRQTTIQHTYAANKQTIQFTRQTDNFVPNEAFFFVRLLNRAAPTAVTINGIAVPTAIDLPTLQAGANNCYFADPVSQSLWILVLDNATPITVVATF